MMKCCDNVFNPSHIPSEIRKLMDNVSLNHSGSVTVPMKVIRDRNTTVLIPCTRVARCRSTVNQDRYSSFITSGTVSIVVVTPNQPKSTSS